ncbi:MAG: phosphoribosylaminoimidazolecarboxamide formyltransferase [Alphaproteobacteria bacterium CG11_big_fil_rev_8_21_14_0_20_44_7]|nr:MAG: phosphoribosylaminoimidazolecarboxamide formyltransferase [Alphaproteobacteria bacterium CG11_big_fil_rev_8_21_14_0_20_44_7]
MSDEKLNSLAERISRLKNSRNTRRGEANEDDASERARGMSMGTRLGVELFAGIGVGTFIGYMIDSFFETLPLFLIIFLFFGAAGGFLNAYRAFMKDSDNN